MTDTYNGWTNYATWRVNLEIFSGQSLRDLGMQKLNLNDLSDALMNYATEIIERHVQWPLCFFGMDGAKKLALDFAMAFIADVNWREIAKNYLEDEGEDEDDTGVLEQAAWYDTSAELK